MCNRCENETPPELSLIKHLYFQKRISASEVPDATDSRVIDSRWTRSVVAAWPPPSLHVHITLDNKIEEAWGENDT